MKYNQFYLFILFINFLFYFGCTNYKELRRIAGDRQTPTKKLVELSDTEDSQTANALAQNPNTPPDRKSVV